MQKNHHDAKQEVTWGRLVYETRQFCYTYGALFSRTDGPYCLHRFVFFSWFGASWSSRTSEKNSPATSLQSYMGASELNVKRIEWSIGNSIIRSGLIPQIRPAVNCTGYYGNVEQYLAKQLCCETLSFTLNLHSKVSAFRKTAEGSMCLKTIVQIFRHTHFKFRKFSCYASWITSGHFGPLLFA